MLNKFLLSKKSDSQPPKLKEGQQGEDDLVEPSIHNVIKKNYEENKKNDEGQKQFELQIISTEHQKLVEQILEEEEFLIGSHKTHIDDLMELAKQEMAYLQDVSKQGADIDIYVNNLESLMIKKMESIKLLKGRLRDFKSHLKQEQDLSKKFYEMQSKVGA
jgi:kinesin family protein 2/24